MHLTDLVTSLPGHLDDVQATWPPEVQAKHKTLAKQLIEQGWDEPLAAKTAAERIVADLIEEATHPAETHL